MNIRGEAGRDMHFTASEALMLLDILKQEEENLRKIARDSSPLPFHISLGGNRDES